MRLKVTYENDTEPRMYSLAADRIYLGNEGQQPPTPGGAARIPLRGAMISAVQCELQRIGEAWMVVHHGINPTRLNDRPLPGGKAHVIQLGDRIWTPNVTIELVDTEVSGPVPVQALATQARVDQLQNSIYEKLLDDAQYDRLVRSDDLKKPEVRARLRERLDEFIRTALRAADRNTFDSVVREGVFRWLVRCIANARRGDDIYRTLTTEGRGSVSGLATIGRQIVQDLQLRLDFDSAQGDVQKLERRFEQSFDRRGHLLSSTSRDQIAHQLLQRNIENTMYRWGPISELMDLDIISEIMVTRYDEIYVEKFGLLERYPYSFPNERRLMVTIERIAADSGRTINDSMAMQDFRMPDGSRVNAVIPPLAVNGACLTIRKFGGKTRLDVKGLVGIGALTEPMREFLQACVRARKNIIVSGGTGSGKTTMLNSLSQYIPVRERVIVVEDTAELKLADLHCVYLQARPQTMEADRAVTIRDLVRNALRMRPDRIVVGECRGAEAVDMLQAMNTGHAGSMTTAHANNPTDLMLRLETMVLQGESSLPVSAIRQQVVAALDVVVQLSRLGDGRRAVTEIAEVIGIDPHTGEVVLEPIFVYQDRDSHRPKAKSGADRQTESAHLFTGYLPSFVHEILELDGDGQVTNLNMFKATGK